MMAAIRVRRKPIILTAEEWGEGVEIEGVVRFGDDLAIIKTLEGPHVISPGYWVITGVDGEKWGVRPDIFWKTYEIVDWFDC